MQEPGTQDIKHVRLLSVVVPITQMAGKLENLRAWLEKSLEYSMSVYLVHDIQDIDTGIELAQLIKEINSTSIVLIEGKFGNPGAARNKGMEFINSKWVAFWDADDIPNLEVAFSALANINQDCQLLVFDFQTQNYLTGEIIQKVLTAHENQNRVREIALDPGLWRFIFDSKLLECVTFPQLLMAEDQIFLSRLEIEKSNICHIPKVEYTYVVSRDGQLTSNNSAVQDLKYSISELADEDKLKFELNKIILIRQVMTLAKRGTLRSRVYLVKIFLKLIFKSRFLTKVGLLKSFSFVIKRIEL